MNNKLKLVLLSGYDGAGSRTFRELVERLQRYFEVQIIDYPYRSQPATRYSLDKLVDHVRISLRNLDKHESFVLLGFSMGGVVATRYAVMYPEQIKELILLNSTTMPITNELEKFAARGLKKITQNPWLANKFSHLYCSPSLKRITAKLPIPRLKAYFGANDGYSVFGSLAMVLWDTTLASYRAGISQLTVPRKALLFEDDLSFPPSKYFHQLQECGFEITVRARGGHAMTDDYWEQVADYLKKNVTRA